MAAKKRAARVVVPAAATTVTVEQAAPKKSTLRTATSLTAAQRAALDDTPFTGFRPAAMTFLRGLKKHNRKEWFEEHRDNYERDVKRPLLALIEEVDVLLAGIAPEIIGSPRRSMFRIHRDVRFSRDKSPYKTHAACWFYHRDAGNGVGADAAHGGAGFYFHFAPEGTFCGGGVWMPPRPALNRIRQSLADDYAGFEDIVLAPAFKRRFGALETEHKLTRAPRGFAPDHPAGDWLRYQSFTAGHDLGPTDFTSPQLPQRLAKSFAALTPFIRWLNTASGLKPSTMR
jgi:uncharacterized protein (TIGR02453 family)